jgi:acid phosphatase
MFRVNNRAFFTPNMQNDGHDTTVDYTGNWTRSFLTPLLNNSAFINKTLVLITFDETETYTIKNNVWALLLGDVIPANLKGTSDDTYYTHWSALSTIQNNWGLYNLGRGDVSATASNVFSIVSNTTGWKNVNVAPSDIPYANFTATGYFDPTNPGPIPAVLTNITGAGGRGVLPSLKGTNGSAIQPPSSSSSSSSSAAASGSSSSGSSNSTSDATVLSTGGMAACVVGFVGFAIGLMA